MAAAAADKIPDEKKVGLVDDVVVRKHIQWFATPEGDITAASMKEGHDKMNITDGVSIKSKAILNLLSDRFPEKASREEPFTIDDLLTVVNEARLGIWTAQGKFDGARLHELMKLFHGVIRSSDGKEAIGATRADFNPELKRIASAIPKERRTGTTIGYVIGVTWEAVTKGSVDELVRYWSDSYVVDPKTGKKVAAITADRTKQFYQDGGWSLFTERAKRVTELRAIQDYIKTTKQPADPKTVANLLVISTAEQLAAEQPTSASCAIM